MKNFKFTIVDTEEAINAYREEIERLCEAECVGEYVDAQEALAGIIKEQPEVVLMDVAIRGGEGLQMIEEIRSKAPNSKVIIVSDINSSTFISKAMDAGVEYFMIKPIDVLVLAKRMKDLMLLSVDSEQKGSRKLEEKITNIFLTVGIPAHIKGYQFLREAIKMAVENPHIINNITKKLYPGIADTYSTTASKVERAIRHAIEVAWNKGKIENINDVFGLHVYDTHEKPTNGEFIALVADKMLLEK